MISERIFNLLLYFEQGEASQYGVRHHRLDGPDSQKLAFLQEAAPEDARSAKRFALPRQFTSSEWLARQRQGVNLDLFEEGLAYYRAPRNPIVCITSIRDGELMIDHVTGLAPLRGKVVGMDLPGEMQDWLSKYTEGAVIRFDKLINDDFFTAIKLLFNAGHIASACKLLMSCIDTISFIDEGDVRGNFECWLDRYVDLRPLAITSAELWQLRNSMVHMTTLSSRAVKEGKVRQLMPYMGARDLPTPDTSLTYKPFNLHALILAVSAGVSRWAESYNLDREKFTSFIERYDSIVSDSRLAWLKPEDGEA